LNDDSKLQDLPLVQGEIKNIVATIRTHEKEDDAGTFILKKMGVWQTNNVELAISEACLDLSCFLHLSMNYYNPRSLAREPLIENWDFELTMF